MTIEQINSTQSARELDSLLSNNTAPEPVGNSLAEGEQTRNPVRNESTQVQTVVADNTTESVSVLDSLEEQETERRDIASRLQEAIELANNFAVVNERRLEFSLNSDSERAIVRVLNRENDELIRQIPSEEFVRISERIRSLNEEYENVRGLLFDASV